MHSDLASSCRAGPGPSSACLSSYAGARRVAIWAHLRDPFSSSSSSNSSTNNHSFRPHIQLCFNTNTAATPSSGSRSSSSSVACHAAASAASAIASNMQQHLAQGPQHLQRAAVPSTVSSSSSCGIMQCCHPAAAGARKRTGRCTASLALAVPATTSTALHTAANFSFSHALAVALGYAVLAGSLFRSVPQIAKVLQHSSTEGLSLTSYVVELCCYSVVIAYNISQGYGFNTFGEVCACWAQDIILIALIFRFNRTPAWAIAGTTLLVALGCCWLLSPACPHDVLAALQASTIATMALGSRLPQIILNIRRGNAGVLSVATCLLNVAGNAARVFTTLVLTGDFLILGGVLTQGCLNVILLCQSIATAKARRAAGADAAASSSSSSGGGGSKGSSSHTAQGKQQQEQDAAVVGSAVPTAADGAGGYIMQPAV